MDLAPGPKHRKQPTRRRKSSTAELWQDLVSAEAPASLPPAIYLTSRKSQKLRAHTPIWERASGSSVWDTQGNKYLDFVGGFGVAAVGHSHPAVSRAIQDQSQKLIHGYGDVHPHRLRALLAKQLSTLLPGRDMQILWAQSGSEAVELSLKTAFLATGRPGVLAFEGAYHGDSTTALAVGGFPEFRRPFQPLLGDRTVRGSYADCRRCPLGMTFPSCRFACVKEAFGRADQKRKKSNRVGAVLVEPILGRGGAIIPPKGYLTALQREARKRGWLLIVDEIFTGLGRTGKLFAHQYDSVRPDMVCVGKVLGGGMPIAAVLGRRRVMSSWGRVNMGGAAAHAATFLAHPVSCAAALATLSIIRKEKLPARAQKMGKLLKHHLTQLAVEHEEIFDIRIRGLFAGIDLVKSGGSGEPNPNLALDIVHAAQDNRLLLLMGGIHGNVIQMSPPLTLSSSELELGITRLKRAFRAASKNSQA